jgi:hypothetical protein
MLGNPLQFAEEKCQIRKEMPMPRIPQHYRDCVVYIYDSDAHARAGEPVGASGFLVGVLSDIRPYVHLYVVTNWHCVVEASEQYCSPFVRLNNQQGDISILELPKRYWVQAEDGCDLAACPIGLEPNTFRFRFVNQYDLITQDILTALSIGPGDEVFLVGRFINHEGRQQNTPTVRFGNIAMMPIEPVFHPTMLPQESFLVELRSKSGYSGSPVFVYIPRGTEMDGVGTQVSLGIGIGPFLLGIEWGHIQDEAEVFTWKVKLDTGMAAVVPAWRLLDLLRAKELIMLREQKEKELADRA